MRDRRIMGRDQLIQIGDVREGHLRFIRLTVIEYHVGVITFQPVGLAVVFYLANPTIADFNHRYRVNLTRLY
jgi:hypothetical protein